MAIVVTKQSASIVRKKTNAESKVSLARVATDLRYMGDVNFGVLDQSKNGNIVAYDSPNNKFVLITPDELVLSSVSDSDLPDNFIRTVEKDLDVAALTEGIDAGTF